MHTPPPAAAAGITSELLRRLDVAGPRYTSYPTADRFVEAFDEQQYRRALDQRRAAGPVGHGGLPGSIYVHLPFCESVCYYCACNKVITRHHERAGAYLDALDQEIALHLAHLGAGQPVSQLHFGGGTPTFLSDVELERLLQSLERAFRLMPGAERSIEIDPRTVDRQRLERLAAMGFNRLSFGVQDFDPAVQKAVHRLQPREDVVALVEAARALGFESINVDLIYGLPRQTPESFARTIAQIGELRPDRIALYAYAHLPQRFKAQRRIDASLLPQPEHRISMLAQAIGGLLGCGYDYIGMDHFALAEDSLAVARRQGRLHRNFQGYSTQPDCDLIGLGLSAIGRVGACYSQNTRELDEYYDALNQGRLPVARGLALSRDDLVRRSVIMALMCQGRLDFESIELAHLIDMREFFRAELEELETLAGHGLVTLEPAAVEVTPLGWYFVRAVAMVFDRYLQGDRRRECFSRLI